MDTDRYWSSFGKKLACISGQCLTERESVAAAVVEKSCIRSPIFVFLLSLFQRKSVERNSHAYNQALGLNDLSDFIALRVIFIILFMLV